MRGAASRSGRSAAPSDVCVRSRQGASAAAPPTPGPPIVSCSAGRRADGELIPMRSRPRAQETGRGRSALFHQPDDAAGRQGRVARQGAADHAPQQSCRRFHRLAGSGACHGTHRPCPHGDAGCGVPVRWLARISHRPTLGLGRRLAARLRVPVRAVHRRYWRSRTEREHRRPVGNVAWGVKAAVRCLVRQDAAAVVLA